jgi:uncharacterized protein
MEFEFDPDKDEVNRFKHELKLAFGMRVFDHDDHIVVGSHRAEDGEDRFKAIGLVDGKLYTAGARVARRGGQVDFGATE